MIRKIHTFPYMRKLHFTGIIYVIFLTFHEKLSYLKNFEAGENLKESVSARGALCSSAETAKFVRLKL